MKMWQKIFRRNINKVNDPEKFASSTNENEVVSTNYGLEQYEKKFFEPHNAVEHKNVLLVNPMDSKEKISVEIMRKKWSKVGCNEWAEELAVVFVRLVVNAIQCDAEEADITNLFNRDLITWKKDGHDEEKIFAKQRLYYYLIKYFNIVEETNDVLKLSYHI